MASTPDTAYRNRLYFLSSINGAAMFLSDSSDGASQVYFYYKKRQPSEIKPLAFECDLTADQVPVLNSRLAFDGHTSNKQGAESSIPFQLSLIQAYFIGNKAKNELAKNFYMALFRRKPDKNTVELTKESALAKISDFFTDPNQEVERFLQNLKTDTPTQQFNSSVLNKIKQMTKSEHSRDFIARVKALENAVPQEASVLNIPMIPQYATFRLR